MRFRLIFGRNMHKGLNFLASVTDEIFKIVFIERKLIRLY